jgi:PAS domain S-box-containing protein
VATVAMDEPHEILSQIHAVAMDTHVINIAIVDSNDSIVASSPVTLTGRIASALPFWDGRIARRLRDGARIQVRQLEDPTKIQGYALLMNKGPTGTGPMAGKIVYVSLDLSDDFDAIRVATANVSIRLGAGVAAILVLLAAFLNETVLRRLTDIIDSMSAIARGDLTRRTIVTGPDEIGTVGDAFNRMADRLEVQNLELVESRARYEQVVEGSADVVVVSDPSGTILFVNRTIEKLIGLTPAEALGRVIFEFVAPEDMERVLTWSRWVRKERVERSTLQLRIQRMDGQLRSVVMDCRVVTGKDGNVERAELFFHDITELRRAEAEEQSSRHRFQALFQGARDAILLVEATTGEVLEVNRRCESLFGASRDEIIGSRLRDLLANPDAGTPHRDGDDEQHGTGTSAETEIIRFDGERIPVEVGADFVDLPDGQRVLQAFVHDIRVRRGIEERLLHAEKMSVIGQLAGGVAHDFNNQLGGILGYAELLEMRLDGKPEAQYVRRIQDAAQRSADLTRRLLSFARKQAPSMEVVDVCGLLDEVTAILKRSVGPSIEVELDLASASHPALVRVEASLLQNALLNIGLNGRDAMPTGGKLAISCRALDVVDPQQSVAAPRIEIRIRDTGEGMDPRTAAQAFDPFFTTKPIGVGTGLGLATSYDTVTGAGGTIRLESKPGRGTTVILELPGTADGAASPTAAPPRSIVTSAPRILVVDDEASIRDVLAEALSQAGYDVTACADGNHAVEAARSATPPFSLVLLDLIMPGMSGADTMAALHTVAPELPVLLISGYPPEGTVNELLAAGAVGLLAKPFRRDELLARVQELAG